MVIPVKAGIQIIEFRFPMAMGMKRAKPVWSEAETYRYGFAQTIVRFKKFFSTQGALSAVETPRQESRKQLSPKFCGSRIKNGIVGAFMH